MKKVQYSRYGGAEELRLEEVALPHPGAGQVRVRVRAASINPMDGKIRRGEMRMLSGKRFPRGLGHDFAGLVDSVGPGVTDLTEGEEVVGVTSIPKAGAIAEYVIADRKNIWIKPTSVGFAEAAAVTIVGLTAWNALVVKGKIRAGHSVFINGCLGGVGRSAVQIALMHGAIVSGTCSATGSEEAQKLGVANIVDYHQLDTSFFGTSFDVVFDTVGTFSLAECSSMLKRGGISLHIVPNVSKWIGSVLSRRHHIVFGNPSPKSFAGVFKAAQNGVLAPAIGRTAPLEEAIPHIAKQEETGLPKGKLVIEVS